MADEKQSRALAVTRDDTGHIVSATQIEEREAYSRSLGLAKAFYRSKYFGIESEDQALVTITAGREVGLGPVSSMQLIHFFKDKRGNTRLVTEAQAMVALGLNSGKGYLSYSEEGDAVTVTGHRTDIPDCPPYVSTWDDARIKLAGLQGKEAHATHPATMKRRRGQTDVCKMLFPDVTQRLSSVDEMREIGAIEVAFVPQEAGLSGTDRVREGLKIPIPGKERDEAVEAPIVDAEITDEDVADF